MTCVQSDCQSLGNEPFSDSQWGFRLGHSTISVLLTVIDDWLRILEDGKEICAIFFDYRKAFDSVPHCPLMGKLFSQREPVLNPVDIGLTYQPITTGCGGECIIKPYQSSLGCPSRISPGTTLIPDLY